MSGREMTIMHWLSALEVDRNLKTVRLKKKSNPISEGLFNAKIYTATMCRIQDSLRKSAGDSLCARAIAWGCILGIGAVGYSCDNREQDNNTNAPVCQYL